MYATSLLGVVLPEILLQGPCLGTFGALRARREHPAHPTREQQKLRDIVSLPGSQQLGRMETGLGLGSIIGLHYSLHYLGVYSEPRSATKEVCLKILLYFIKS